MFSINTIKFALAAAALAVTSTSAMAGGSDERGGLFTSTKAQNVVAVSVNDSRAQVGGVFLKASEFQGDIRSTTNVQNGVAVAVNQSSASIGGVYTQNASIRGTLVERTDARNVVAVAVNASAAQVGGITIVDSRREVITAMAKAYVETKGSLADRLMAALVAGDRAGGDHRGRLAAGLRVAKTGAPGYWLDLQVDKSDDAMRELAEKFDNWRRANGHWRTCS